MATCLYRSRKRYLSVYCVELSAVSEVQLACLIKALFLKLRLNSPVLNTFSLHKQSKIQRCSDHSHLNFKVQSLVQSSIKPLDSKYMRYIQVCLECTAGFDSVAVESLGRYQLPAEQNIQRECIGRARIA